MKEDEFILAFRFNLNIKEKDDPLITSKGCLWKRKLIFDKIPQNLWNLNNITNNAQTPSIDRLNSVFADVADTLNTKIFLAA